MSDRIKKIKVKKADGSMTDYIPIGADAENIDTADGESVEIKLNKKPYYYNNVANMKADTKLKVGDMAVTLGYYEPNDGGNGEYIITNDSTLTDDGGSVHDLENGFKAKLIIKNNEINVKQFGAYGNKEHDDTLAIQKAINYFHVGTDEEGQNTALVLSAKYPAAGGTIIFTKAEYSISSTIFIPFYVNVDFNDSRIYALGEDASAYTKNYMFAINSKSCTNWIYAYPGGQHNFFKNAKSINGNRIQNLKGLYVASSTYIRDIQFNGLYNSITYANVYLDNCTLENITCDNICGNAYQIYKTGQGENLKFNNIVFPVYRDYYYDHDTSNYVYGIYLAGAGNGIISNIINGSIFLSRCRRVEVSSWHCENGFFKTSDEQGHFILRNSEIYVLRNTDNPIQLGNQTSENRSRSTVIIENVNLIYYYRLADYNWETIDIDTSKYYGLLYIKNVHRECRTKGFAQTSLVGISIKMSDTQTFLNPYEECQIYNRCNPKVINSYSSALKDYDKMITVVQDAESSVDWLLPDGTYYYRGVYILDKDRKIGSFLPEGSVTRQQGPGGTRIVIGADMGNNFIVRIYRGMEAGIYTHYVEIPNIRDMALYDNGYALSGYQWKEIDEQTQQDIIKAEQWSFNNFIETIPGYTSSNEYLNKYNVISYAEKIPTYGNYIKGDRIINRNPKTGLFSEYICVEDGNPGMWRSKGIIEEIK